MLKAGSEFKVSASNLKVIVRPLYWQNTKKFTAVPEGWMPLAHSLPVQHWAGEFNLLFSDLTTDFHHLMCGYKEDGGSFFNRNDGES